jgi:hypothetical protein
LDISLLVISLLLGLELVPFTPSKVRLEQPTSKPSIYAPKGVDIGEAEEPGKVAASSFVVKIEDKGTLGLKGFKLREKNGKKGKLVYRETLPQQK